MTDEQRKQQREAWQDKNCTKQITCPEHPKGDHTATLYQHGHRFSGIWECPVTGTSDSCEHENGTEIEEVVEDHMGFSGHYQTEHEIYVCVDCGEQVDGDPAEDRAEAIADMQIMEALGK